MAPRDRASSKRGDSSPVAWVVVLGLVVACEREGATRAPSPAAASEAPASAAPQADDQPEPAPAPADPTPTDPAAGDPAQVERVLAEYHRLERFLRSQPDPSELLYLSEADQTLLRSMFEHRFTSDHVRATGETVRKLWLERMSEAAARGEPPSTIRMPLYTNVGWGCEVPSDWVATGYFSGDVIFIVPVGDTKLMERCMPCHRVEDEELREQCIEQRCYLQVQGHFTGKIIKRAKDCESTGYELHVERATANSKRTTPFFLALPGGAPPPDGPPITEGPRWGVLFSGAFRHEANARERADALQVRLLEKGHGSAQVLDSRRIPTLWCCSFAVLVERFVDQEAAKALAERLKHEGFDGVFVRELY